MEKFLDFWSHYNAAIIETLVALILISTIYIVYRSFFGSKAGGDLDHSAGGGVDTAQIEKTLQKILDQQQKSGDHVAASHAHAGATSGGGEAPAELVANLANLKKALEEKEREIVILQTKAAEANKAVAAAGPAASTGSPSPEAIAAAANAAAGLAEKERQDYEAKIKELEARLAEYEIISEDIADLSFFKEENARLTKELEALKASGGGAAPAAAAPAAPVAPPAPAAPVEAAAPAAAAAEPVVETPIAAEPALAVPEPANPEENAAANTADGINAIDDSLMAEFAKAVEGQKSGTLEESAKPAKE